MTTAALFRRDRLATTIMVLLAAATCARLGIWQLDRLAQRRAFNAKVEINRALPTLDLPSTENLALQEYRAARVTGQYDFKRQFAIRNQEFGGQYGYRLITPLIIQDPSQPPTGAPLAVLVDRGWIPGPGNEQPEDWRKYDLPGVVEAKGILRLEQHDPVADGLASAAAASSGHFRTYVDIEQFRSEVPYRLLPVYVQEDKAVTGDPPVASAIIPDLDDGPHLGYAVQWFAFAALFVIGYPAIARKMESR
jgi:surfeit locus 1 family protein